MEGVCELSVPVMPLAYKVVMYCAGGRESMALVGDAGMMMASVEGAVHPIHVARCRVFVHCAAAATNKLSSVSVYIVLCVCNVNIV